MHELWIYKIEFCNVFELIKIKINYVNEEVEIIDNGLW